MRELCADVPRFERLVRAQAGGSERFENAVDLFLEDWNIVQHCKPHLVNVDAEVIMNQLVAHPGEVIPRDVFTVRANSFRQPLCCLPNDFDLANYSILSECIFLK